MSIKSGELHFEDLFIDPTDGHVLAQRFLRTLTEMAADCSLDDVQRERLQTVLTLVAYKMAAAWRHKQEYAVVENRLIDRARNEPPPAPPVLQKVFVSQHLFSELDEFLVQVKSALDHLVKVPSIIVGRNRWNLSTFGDKGEKVIRAIGSLPNSYQASAEAMKDVVRKHQQVWLSEAVDIRDRLNHLVDGGVEIKQFTVSLRTENGVELVDVPKWSPSQSIRAAIENVWWNLLALAEEFTVMFLFHHKPELKAFQFTPVPLGSPTSPWSVILAPHLMEALVNQMRATAADGPQAPPT